MLADLQDFPAGPHTEEHHEADASEQRSLPLRVLHLLKELGADEGGHEGGEARGYRLADEGTHISTGFLRRSQAMQGLAAHSRAVSRAIALSRSSGRCSVISVPQPRHFDW